MHLQSFYVKSIDEIDTINLSNSQIRARKIAKNVSLIPVFPIYALFLPLLMILYYIHQPTQEKVQTLILYFIIKPIRWLGYKIVLFICNIF
ncbi:hypothetical protein NIES4074_39350 [Cylindrospermum sp. NIES-4074]|jgi:hypothetical protein|nr:hypothetical protein NIES4074_39350 [Cylindrospermum sp. NIES-4074]